MKKENTAKVALKNYAELKLNNLMKRIEDIQNTLMVRNSLSDIIYSQTRNNAYSIVSNSLQINNSINQNSFRTNKTQINTNEQISVTCPNLSDARNVNNISSIRFLYRI